MHMVYCLADLGKHGVSHIMILWSQMTLWILVNCEPKPQEGFEGPWV